MIFSIFTILLVATAKVVTSSDLHDLSHDPAQHHDVITDPWTDDVEDLLDSDTSKDIVDPKEIPGLTIDGLSVKDLSPGEMDILLEDDDNQVMYELDVLSLKKSVEDRKSSVTGVATGVWGDGYRRNI